MPAVESTPSLFDTFADRSRERLDAVLRNEGCPWKITTEQRRLLELLRWHQGRDRVMSLGEVGERLRLTPRQVKELIQDLRLNFRISICASRDAAAGGYYLAATLAEVDESIAPMLHQAVTMLRVCRAMRGSDHNQAEFMGQIQLRLEKEETDGEPTS